MSKEVLILAELINENKPGVTKGTKRVIKRYFSEHIFKHIKSDFGFLIDRIIKSGFEYDFQIRDDYFNLYYKGNSIGNISYRTKTQLYAVKIHNKFVDDKIKAQFTHKEADSYLVFTLEKKRLHPLFRKKNLESMAQRVKVVNYQEEITFEQMIITDNVNNSELIIIDRQIKDGKIMDLLALTKNESNNYQFCVIEVKLGNSPELRGKVSGQLKGYVDRISNNFDDYKYCYEKNFSQKQELGLFNSPRSPSLKSLKINIVPGVSGVVVVSGYSGIAENSIDKLKEKDPAIRILHLKNVIDLSKTI